MKTTKTTTTEQNEHNEENQVNVILENLEDTLPNSAIEDIIADTIHQEEALIETIQKLNQQTK